MKLYRVTVEHEAYVYAKDELSAEMMSKEIAHCEDPSGSVICEVKPTDLLMDGYDGDSGLYGSDKTLSDVFPKTVIKDGKVYSGVHIGFSQMSNTIEIELECGSVVIMYLSEKDLASIDRKKFFRGIGSYKVSIVNTMKEFKTKTGMTFKNTPRAYDEMSIRFGSYLIGVPFYDPMEDPEQGKLFGDSND